MSAAGQPATQETAAGQTSDFSPVLAFLRSTGLAATNEAPDAAPLTGGVSSDIWKVELKRGTICVKRALSRLRVAQVWEAPVERNRTERLWMETAERICPGSTPQILAGGDTGFFAMAYLDPATHPLWKSELAAGRADPVFAARTAGVLAQIHARTANREDIAAQFATDANFHAIRLEPYLLATGRAHPGLAARLGELAAVTADTRRALVHGDVSPKNILVGPQGPVFLDAECAWYGDPAFDLSFCLNHLLLKCLWVPGASASFLACYTAFADAYLAGVDWEARDALEARAAALLPGLMLARVDGKSPAEYLVLDSDKNTVRETAASLLRAPVARLADLRRAWSTVVVK